MKANFMGLVSLIVLSACSSLQDKPIVDLKGVNLSQYNADLAECEVYADGVSVTNKTAEGAVAGTLIGGVVGATAGGTSRAKRGAGTGAAIGGARGAIGAFNDKERIVRTCLRGRGYRVLL